MKILKYSLFTLLGILALLSCKDTTKTISDKQDTENTYNLKGESFEAENPKSAEDMSAVYNNLKPSDTAVVTFEGKVDAVCKKKGCWMTLNMPKNETAMVKFKDYGFFMPKDIENENVIVHGKAFVEEVSVEDQRHFAQDAGKTEEEIAAITAPKRTYSFLADGVLVQNNEKRQKADKEKS